MMPSSTDRKRTARHRDNMTEREGKGAKKLNLPKVTYNIWIGSDQFGKHDCDARFNSSTGFPIIPPITNLMHCRCVRSQTTQATQTCLVSIRQHTSAYVNIRQHTLYESSDLSDTDVSHIRQHTSADVSIRQHTLYESSDSSDTGVSCIRQHTSAYVGIRQHMMMMLCLFKEFSKESQEKEALLSPCIGSIKA